MASRNRGAQTGAVAAYLALTGTAIAIVAALVALYVGLTTDPSAQGLTVIIVVVLVLVSAGFVGASLSSLSRRNRKSEAADATPDGSAGTDTAAPGASGPAKGK